MKVVAALIAALVVVGPAVPATRGVVAMDRSLDGTLVARINDLRVTNGLAPLRPSAALTRAAAAHTQDMLRAGYFAHVSRDGSPFWKRVRRYYPAKGFRGWSVGENLVWGSPSLTSDETLQAWLESPEHRANLLNPRWREIGLAAAHADSAPGMFGAHEATVVTADFGTRSRAS
jgi:uncharacterized protein YkwD